MLETGTEIVDIGILVEDTQALVDHGWSQGRFGELRESASEFLDNGIEGIVAGIEDAHCMVVSAVPFLG